MKNYIKIINKSNPRRTISNIKFKPNNLLSPRSILFPKKSFKTKRCNNQSTSIGSHIQFAKMKLSKVDPQLEENPIIETKKDFQLETICINKQKDTLNHKYIQFPLKLKLFLTLISSFQL